jgi:protein SCO1
MRSSLQPLARVAVGLMATALLPLVTQGRFADSAPLQKPGPVANASSLPDDTLSRIRFDQRLGSQVPLELDFRDEGGRAVRLGDYFGRRPVILVLGYYECPMLCTLVLNGLVETLLDLKLDVGSQFEVVNVSIDPRETPSLAAAKKRAYLRRYGRHGADAGWHFLTGDEPAIQRLAQAVGFHYAYDDHIKQYAHPTGLMVLTPGGQVARYFFGVNYPSREVAASLRQAGAGQTGSPVEQLFLLCFHYSPVRGRYGNLALAVLRVGGVATLVLLGGLVVRGWQHRPTRGGRGREASEPGAEAEAWANLTKEEGA